MGGGLDGLVGSGLVSKGDETETLRPSGGPVLYHSLLTQLLAGFKNNGGDVEGFLQIKIYGVQKLLFGFKLIGEVNYRNYTGISDLSVLGEVVGQNIYR